MVLERELKLRQALKTMGMMDSAFWTSWTVYELAMSLITSLLLAGFGAMWQVSPAHRVRSMMSGTQLYCSEACWFPDRMCYTASARRSSRNKQLDCVGSCWLLFASHSTGVLKLTRRLCTQFSLFLKNSFALVFLLFFTFQLAMMSLAFLLSTAVAKASSGTNLVRCPGHTTNDRQILLRP